MMCFDLAFLIIGLIPSSFFFLFLRGEFICSSRFYSPIIRKGLTALRCLEFTTNWFFSFFNLLHQVLPLNIATDLPQARHICWGTVPWIKHDIFFLVLSSLACFRIAWDRKKPFPCSPFTCQLCGFGVKQHARYQHDACERFCWEAVTWWPPYVIICEHTSARSLA